VDETKTDHATILGTVTTLPDSITPIGNLDRVRLLLVAGLCYAAFQGLRNVVQIPSVTGISGSVFQDGAIGAFVLVALLFVSLTFIATQLARGFRADAGLFCATFGLLAIPLHGGDVRNVLLTAGGTSQVYWLLAAEMICLGLLVMAGYWVVLKFNALKTTPTTAAASVVVDTFRDRALTILMQAAAMIGILSIIGQSPAKGQALIGCGAAALLASLLVHQIQRVQGSIYYIVGALLGAVIAYVVTAFSTVGADVADPRGYLAAAARSLPLHYATLGVAGSIYGYWVSVIWANSTETETEAAPASV